MSADYLASTVTVFNSFGPALDSYDADRVQSVAVWRETEGAKHTFAVSQRKYRFSNLGAFFSSSPDGDC